MSELPVFMAEVPEYEVRGGRMHVTLKGFEIVMPLGVFLAGAARADEAIRQWYAKRHGTVVEFPLAAKH